MDLNSQYILDANRAALGNLVNGPLWADAERALLNRRPEVPDPKDPSHIAAAKGHRRAGYEQCLADIKKLPFDAESTAKSPFESPALDTKD